MLRNGFVYVLNERSLMLGEKKVQVMSSTMPLYFLFRDVACKRLQPIFKQFVYLIKHCTVK